MAPHSKADRDRHVARTTLVASLTVLAVAAAVWLLYRISNVLFMGFVSVFIAIALEPPVDYLARRGWKRGAATGVVFLATFLLTVGFIVALAPLLIGVWPRAVRLLAALSAFLFASLYFAAGFGRRITTQADLEALRMAMGIDLSVVVAAAHVALLSALLVWVARTSSGRLRSVAP